MSLAGIREMSTITTPPEDRHPILTYVGAYDEKLVAAAIRRELLRDGQVFFVHNRVSDIEAVDQAAPRGRAGGQGRGGPRPDERAHPGEGDQRLLAARVRRAGLHHDRRDRPGHLQREHPDRRPLRDPRAVPDAPAPRPGRSRTGARLRLLPVSAGPDADRDRPRPAGHHRAERRAGRRPGGRDEGPGDPRRRLDPRRRAERAHRRRRVRPVRPVGRGGRDRVQEGGGRGRRGRTTSRSRSRSGSNCRSTPTSRRSTSRPSGCGSTPTGGSQRPRDGDGPGRGAGGVARSVRAATRRGRTPAGGGGVPTPLPASSG